MNKRWLCFLLIMSCWFVKTVKAQTTTQIVEDLRSVNFKVTNVPCNTGNGMLISSKAMNIFLSNKVSSYLSDGTDLSLYKNYLILNAADGSIAIDHNFHQPVDSDDWVRSFTVMGARVNIANTYAARFSNKYYDNRMGLVLQQTWMGKQVTSYNACGSQKMAMDAGRAQIVHSLGIELNRKAADFERGLDSMKQAEVPGQNLKTAREKLRKDFYAGLRAEYLQKFSQAQSDLLVNSNNFNLVTDHWTTVGVYIPIIAQKFMVSGDINTAAQKRYNYPFELSVSHTRFWESNKFGRLFFTLNAKAFVNNSVQGGALYQAEAAGQTGIGGTINRGNFFVGEYQNFITPVAAAKLAWLPLTSHFGLSMRIEKNFGTYHALNSIIGVPITLIDKNDVPTITFEAQVIFSDMTNSIKNTQLPYNRTAIGLTVGIPFSKIVY